ncbi:hypothetical protein J5N97_007069 [Dioscorea zingiberensis]|uniref:Protein EARLY HEADING DATE 2 n=1 Tax=Dioscorea zingiberensis TaxID=325984 RepID=A0A9D5HU46_9LILI|nr:hypothetical protein J5N97_007069 [Dioscorea zingiberensis]
MSNTSEDESQQPFMAVTGKPDTAVSTPPSKKRRSLPGNPDPDAEVVALSPKTLLATNRYVCEVCHKGFQRDQNLQLHRRGHNLPWKLKQRTSTEVKKKVYVCPEVTCVHHNPSRALGDLTGIKKHFSRKHGEKKWKCDKCSKKYAVQSDWKAHAKICGTKEYRCDCGTIFSRKDSFVTHRAFCDALAEENYRTNHGLASMVGSLQSQTQDLCSHSMPSLHSSSIDTMMNSTSSDHSLSLNPLMTNSSEMIFNPSAGRTSGLQLGGMNMMSSGTGSGSLRMSIGSSYMSATALLQKAAEMGAKVSDDSISPILLRGFTGYSSTSRPSAPMQETLNSPHTNTFSSAVADATTYVGNNPSGSQMNAKWSETADHHAYPVSAENHCSMIGLEAGQMRRNTTNTHEDMAERRDGRMTQDFLGLGPVGINTGITDHGYVENSVGIRYSDEHQQNQEDMYTGYHHSMSQGQQPALAKPMWDF